jgi:stage II sporulation protein D
VNIARLGTSYAVLSSTGTVTVTGSGGGIVYQGGLRTLARTNVRRLAEGGGIDLPPRNTNVTDLSSEERQSRAQLFRDARHAVRDEPRALINVAFEFTVLQNDRDDVGKPLISSDRVVGLHVATSDGFLTFNGRAFRGTFDVALDDEGDMIIVNEVGTAEYLASVVGSEEPTSWEPEALAAQAIAARTYLVTHLARHRAYDLEGDTRDQEYDGVGSEATSTVKAVERTAGIIATYRGTAIEALYSANAGGVTEDSENVYASALPYLRSVPSPTDETAKSSSWGHTSWEWTREFTGPQLRDYLLVRGINVGDVERVELTQLSKTGRVLAARIVGNGGSRDIGKDRSRYYFGLLSTLFTVNVRPANETEFVAYTNIERLRTLELLGATIDAPAYTRTTNPDRETLDIRTIGWIYRLPARFVFTGKGYGHGVGMSQWGAQGMALKGASAAEILRHYYLGIALTNIGGA